MTGCDFEAVVFEMQHIVHNYSKSTHMGYERRVPNLDKVKL